MATGKYATHIDELDVEVPGKNASYAGWRRKETKYFQFGTQGQNVPESIAIANRLPIITSYVLLLLKNGDIECHYYSEKGKKICQVLNMEVWG